MRTIKAPPQAALLVESMRDMGYSLKTALADIVDNSITAGATHIRVMAPPTSETGQRRIAILDDGIGMSSDELHSAMRLGSRSPRDDRAAEDLGRFGLGLILSVPPADCRKSQGRRDHCGTLGSRSHRGLQRVDP
jgi:signal transduction histidine kinase